MLRWLVLLTLCAPVFADSDNSVLAPLEDLSNGPVDIQTSGKAVVRVQGLGATGSGVFIPLGEGKNAPTGLLTSEHVLGPKNCTLEGCFVILDFHYGNGGKWTGSKDYYAVPIARIPDLDAGVFQILKIAPDGKPLDALEVEHTAHFARASERIIKNLVYLVGHPLGALKKWTKGDVLTKRGEWYDAKLLSVDGNSGSPVFNGQGEIVGIMDRTIHPGRSILSFRAAQFDSSFANHSSISERIANILKDKQSRENATKGYQAIPEPYVVHAADNKPFPFRLLMSKRVRSTFVEKEGVTQERGLGWWLLRQCRQEVDGRGNLENPYSYCAMVFDWVNCNNPNDGAYYKFCPTPEEINGAKGWLELFKSIALAQVDNGGDSYKWAVRAPSLFSRSKEESRKFRRRELREFQKLYQFPYVADEILAYAESALTRDDMTIDGGENLIDRLTNFTQAENFEWQGGAWAEATMGLARDGILKTEERNIILAKFMKAQIPVLYKLLFESKNYEVEQSPIFSGPLHPMLRLP